ncbi:MAG: type 1 glutamine amidotransferase domain-containing protein [Candidatus Thiodiazotropha sp. LLP2]
MDTLHSLLMIVTSFSEISPGEPTGLWLEEFAVPYIEFTNQGYRVSVASVKGGKAPIDPRSDPTAEQAETWAAALKALEETIPVASIVPTDYDAVFIPGGHGTMFDFPNSHDLHKALRGFAEHDKIIAAMCHGPASLVGVILSDGTPLVAGKTLTSFTNEEESVAGFTKKMPFLMFDLPDNFFLIEAQRAPSWDMEGAYLPPCSGGKGNDYYVTIKAVSEINGGIRKILSEVELPLGQY